jgi:hypothetical protein
MLMRTMVGAMIALMSFTLAVTFWIAATHFDGSRQARLNDINAIRAAYLHSDLLPEPYRAQIRALLREYVDVRVEGVISGNLEKAIPRSEEIQSLLWSRAMAGKEKTLNPVFDNFLTRSLTDVSTHHAKRVAVYREFNIPTLVWGALYAITALAMASIGCYAGLTSARRPPVVPAFVLIFSVVMILIADLDSPQSGAFRVSHKALFDLQHTMNAPDD